MCCLESCANDSLHRLVLHSGYHGPSVEGVGLPVQPRYDLLLLTCNVKERRSSASCGEGSAGIRAATTEPSGTCCTYTCHNITCHNTSCHNSMCHITTLHNTARHHAACDINACNNTTCDSNACHSTTLHKATRHNSACNRTALLRTTRHNTTCDNTACHSTVSTPMGLVIQCTASCVLQFKLAPIDTRSLDRQPARLAPATAGKQWFNLPAQQMTDDTKRDLKLLQLRGTFDPKRFYKSSDHKKGLPKFFQVGTVVESSADFYSGMISAGWTSLHILRRPVCKHVLIRLPLVFQMACPQASDVLAMT